jgi:NADH:quinone reductase (non-electrogenic)
MIRDFRSIRPQDARIMLIEAGVRILPELPEELSIKAEQSLTKRGVKVLKASPVTAVWPSGVAVGGENIVANTVLWTAGVKPSPIAHSLDTLLDHRGRIIVQPDLSVAEHPEVFAIGDVASVSDAAGKSLPGIAPVAIQGGECAAKNVLSRARGERTMPFVYRDKGVLVTLGRADAVAKIGHAELHGFSAWATWLGVHISYLIGFRNRLFVLADWSWAYLMEHPQSRLVMCDIDRHAESLHGT